MYAPDWEKPCPSCSSILDRLNGIAPHVTQRANFAVTAKAPIQSVRDWARGRDWKNFRLLSSGKSSYNSDYGAETAESGQIPL